MWEIHKETPYSAKEQQITRIMNGPHGSSLQRVLDIIEKGMGYLDTTQHGVKFILDVGVTNAQCHCGWCCQGNLST